MEMDHLAAALALAGVPARRSATAGAAFAAFESTHGQPLPRAVRDWYLLDRARTVLEPDGADLVLAAEQLGGPATYWWPADGDDWPPDLEEQEEREFDPVAAGLLPFLDENQGGYSLAVRLDGSADPPVLISWDGVRPDGWSVHAACFSEWVFTRVWDLPLLRGAGRLYGTVPDVGQSELAVLARRLTARPQTVSDSPLPGPPQVGHRFAGPGDRQRALLLSPYAVGGTWSVLLWAATDDLLVDLCGVVRSALAAPVGLTGAYRPDEVARRALERLAAGEVTR
ncbi:SMI1/KNR4 family protein [Catellatospora bangladeshensis]|nr:SMI1/KNR4 family protein [Catellatospora bangladeshensis]